MKINISIDDVSPHPFSSIAVIEKCEELIQQFPDIKFSLFVPMAYWRTQKPGTITGEALNLSKFPDFCEELKDLDPKNYEIGYHGYFHGIPGKSDLMFEEAERSGLTGVFKKIFRPPAWRMSPEAFKCLSDRGFELFAVTDLDYALQTYAGAEKKYPSTFSTQFPPFKELKKQEKCGIVYHACEWDRNYLSAEHVASLVNFLNKDPDSEFCFLGEFK